MKELTRHIEILLLHNDCVIVPELGGFIAHHVSARIDNAGNMFVPPQRTLGFNPLLTMSDSLLAESYMEVHDLSFPEAMKRIQHEVEQFKEEEHIIRISAIIYVERDSQKGIIIGKAGSALKRVGSQARRDIEAFFGKQVFLQLFVKVDKEWRSSKARLRHYGYDLS